MNGVSTASGSSATTRASRREHRGRATSGKAIADGAVAIVDEGTGVDASWQIARDADVPIGITYQGGEGLVDPAKRPNVFRIAPTDHGISFRLAEYLIPKKLKVALLTDDSAYGAGGREGARRGVRAQPGARSRPG